MRSLFDQLHTQNVKKSKEIVLLMDQLTDFETESNPGMRHTTGSPQHNRATSSTIGQHSAVNHFMAEELQLKENELLEQEEMLQDDLEKEQFITKSLTQKMRAIEKDKVILLNIVHE